MANGLSVENSVRARVGVSVMALLAGCVGVGVSADVAHAAIVETPISSTLSGPASVAGNLVDGRTIMLGAGASANVQTQVQFSGIDGFYNRPMMGYQAQYGGADSFFFDRRTLIGGNRYDFFGAPATGPYPATVTGSTRFGSSGTDETYADTGSSAGGMTLTQQLGTAAPLVASNMGVSINISRQGPSLVRLLCAYTIDVSRGTTFFGALGGGAWLPSAYNDQFFVEIDTVLDSRVEGLVQESRNSIGGFVAGQSGTWSGMLSGGVTFYQRDDDNPLFRPNVEITGRVRWVNEAGASVVLPGSEFRYFGASLPTPGGAAALLGCGGVVALRRRRGK